MEPSDVVINVMTNSIDKWRVENLLPIDYKFMLIEATQQALKEVQGE